MHVNFSNSTYVPVLEGDELKIKEEKSAEAQNINFEQTVDNFLAMMQQNPKLSNKDIEALKDFNKKLLTFEEMVYKPHGEALNKFRDFESKVNSL